MVPTSAQLEDIAGFDTNDSNVNSIIVSLAKFGDGFGITALVSTARCVGPIDPVAPVSGRPFIALARTCASAALPRKIPAALTETERTPAPESSSRQPPLSLLVITTVSPEIDIWVVRRPATVR